MVRFAAITSLWARHAAGPPQRRAQARRVSHTMHAACLSKHTFTLLAVRTQYNSSQSRPAMSASVLSAFLMAGVDLQ